MPDRNPDDEFNIELTDDEAEMLIRGLDVWSGPGRITDALARVMGFRDILEFDSLADELGDRILAREFLTRRDWTRVIKALEIGFGSDEGAGWEWSIVTRFNDEFTINALRGLQGKLIGIRLQGAAGEFVI
jgi:hypothetical protein